MINAVVFDVGGVLLESRGPITKVVEQFGVSLRDVVPLFSGPTAAENRIETAFYSTADLRPLFLESLPDGLTEQAAELVDALLHRYRDPTGDTNGELLELITQLRSSGVKVGVLSNGPSDAAEKQETLLFREHPVDAWILSGRDGVGKPDPAAFHLIASQLGVDPSECLFVDDTSEHVEAGQRAGMQGFHFTGDVELLTTVLAGGGISVGAQR